MNLINTILGTPLGYLMYFCYLLVKNYGLAIILFTLLSKIILFPLSISVQKNSIRMVKLQPKMDEIKAHYAGDKDRIADEQIKLYDGEKYSPAMGCLPTLIQIPLILGLINVIYNPLKHLLHLPATTTDQLAVITSGLLGVEKLGSAAQLQIIDAVHDSVNLPAFQALSSSIPNIDHVLAAIQGMDMTFFGINLGMTPSLLNPSPLILIPVLSGITCLIMCLIQNRINVLQREQSTANKLGMSIFLVAFSTYFPFMVPTGVGLYWIFSNIFSILVMFLVNIIIDPQKHIDYVNRPQKLVLTKEQKALERLTRKENRIRESADNKRFYDDDNAKQLVFYSAKSGFYKYFENVIGYILANSDIVVHYVTSDPNDAIFTKNETKIIPYYIGDKALIPFMMKMDADMVVMTMPDIETYHIKRSLVRKDIEYVYMFHGMSSVNMIYREGAFDHYDTIFCIGPYHLDEIRATERVYDLPPKKLVPFGYSLIDNLIASYDSLEKEAHKIPKILIAPSWQMGNIMESCLDEILEQLLPESYCIIVRPHPEFVKRFPHRMKTIVEKYSSNFNDNFMIETDFSSNVTIFTADLVISDWSGIAFEYSYSTKRPCLLINTPMKIMNPEYMAIDLVPVDISLRDQLGVSLDTDKLDQVSTTVAELLAHNQDYSDRIRQVVEENLFNIGHSGEVGGQYIIKALFEKEQSRREQGDDY